ncbi:MAG: PEP-CTERM system TPR-repeat protein PrsT [Sphingomonadaceae bacterium]|nr:PEP-CTERM system TPR-repeat protein PrsT [Sphingomonadaceae bacterium]
MRTSHRSRFRTAALAAATLAIASACGKSGPDPAASKQSYQSALTKFNKGDLRSARIDLLTALKQDQNNADARILFARVLLARGNGIQAQAEIEKAVKAGYPQTKANHLLAHAQLLQNNPRRALELADPKINDPEFAAYAARMRGRAKIGLNDKDGALAEFQQASTLAPTDPEVWADLARFRAASGDLTGAIAFADKSLAAAPDNTPALMLKAELVRASQGVAASLPFYDKVIATDANNVEALLKRAATLGDLNREKDARADIKRVKGLQPNNPLALYLEAVLEAKANRWDKAQQILNDTKNTLANYPPAQLLQGFVALQLNNPTKAAEALTKVVAATPDNPAGRRLLAFAQLRTNDARSALQTLAPFAQQPPEKLDPGMLALLGSAYAQAGQMQNAERYLQLSANSAGDNQARAPIQTQLAMTKLAQGDAQGAEQELQRALTSNPNSAQALISLAMLRMNERRLPDAVAITDKLVQVAPDLALGYNLRAAAKLGMGDAKAAETDFRKAVQVDPKYTDARRNLAKLLFGQNRIDDGVKELEGVLSVEPNDLQSLQILAQVAASRGKKDQSIEYLRRGVAAQPGSIPARAMLVEAYVRNNQIDRALNEANNLFNANPKDPRAAQLLAATQVAAKQPGLAVKTLRDFADKNPTLPIARVIYARALRATNQPQLARAAYDEALSIPQAPVALILNDLVALELQARNVPGALKAAERLRTEGKQPVLADKLTGDIQSAAGNLPAALAAYQRVYAQAKTGQAAALVVGTLTRMGRVPDAIATIDQYRKANPRDPLGAVMLGDIQLARRDWRGAVATYQSIANTPAAQNPIILNNLAWALSQLNDPRALPTAAAAYRAAPQAPAILDTYGWLLVAGGTDRKQGLILLEQAARGLPGDPGVQLHLGQAYKMTGDSARARQQLTMLAQKAPPPFNQQARAELASIR